MSLDIGLGLAHLTGRTLTPYSVQPAWCSDPVLRHGEDYEQRATVLDLFDLPIPVELTHAEAGEIEFSDMRRLFSEPVNESVLCVSSAASLDSEDFAAFKNGRGYVQTLEEAFGDDEDALLDVTTLGMYSQFFYASDAVKSDLRRIFGEVRPRQPYRDLGRRIAELSSIQRCAHPPWRFPLRSTKPSGPLRGR